jgi:hypothetical protein
MPIQHSATRIGCTLAATLALAFVPAAGQAADTSPAQQLAQFSALASRPGNAPAGQAFFGARHGGEWSCSSCHGAPPTQPGKHASTGKTIAPLAPAFNPAAFTDTAKVEKWFRRNCNDVLKRECNAGEKADLLAYLNQIKP